MVSTILSTKPKSFSDDTKASEDVDLSKMEQNENGGTHASEHKGRWISICCSLAKFLISLALLLFSSLIFYVSVTDLHYQMNDYEISTVTKYIDFPKNVTFPAITICNNNRIQKNKLIEKYPLLGEKHGGHMLRKNIQTHPDFNFMREMPSSELAEFGQSFSDLVEDCLLIDGEMDNQECGNASRIYFEPMMNCFTFLSHNNSLSGDYKKTGLWMRVNFQPEEYTEEFVPVGGRVYLHDEKEKLPIVGKGLSGYPLKPGFLYTIAVKRTTYSRLPPPYEPGCKYYFSSSEGTSQNECYNECLINKFIDRCGCQPRFVAYSKPREHHIACNISRKTASGSCYRDNKQEFEEQCDEFCPITCIEDKYEVKIEAQEIPTYNSEMKKDKATHSRILIQYDTNEHQNFYYDSDQHFMDIKCSLLCLWAFLILFLMWLTFKTAKQLCSCSKKKNRKTGSANSA